MLAYCLRKYWSNAQHSLSGKTQSIPYYLVRLMLPLNAYIIQHIMEGS